MILYDDKMSWGHGDGYVVLRTPMDGPMIKVAYGNTMIHTIEAVWEMLVRKEWLGCRHYKHVFVRSGLYLRWYGVVTNQFIEVWLDTRDS